MDNDLRHEELQTDTHHRPEKGKDDKLKLRNTLNILFILFALLTIALYFILPQPEGKVYFFISCFIAIIIKMVESSIRMSVKKNKKQ